LRFVNVGNELVRLNLVPVDFVVEGMATLSKDERSIGKTIALADPNPLTTAELFNEIAQALSGKKSVINPPWKLIEKSLMLPVSPAISGLPHSAVPYFFISQTYDTSVAQQMLALHDVACLPFPSYVKNLIRFVEKNPHL
jgi:hypothetical protein